MNMKFGLFTSVLLFILANASKGFGQWIEKRTAPPAPYGSASCLLGDGPVIYAGTGEGVYRSTNNGASWQTSNLGIPNANILGLLGRNGNIYADTYFGTFHSTDSGNTWHKLSAPSAYYWNRLRVVNDSAIFMQSLNLFRSTDDGNTWVRIDSSLPALTNAFVTGFDNELEVWTPLATYVSSDNGSSWSRRNGYWPFGTGEFTSLSVLAAGPKLFAGTGGGAFVSTDSGVTWNSIDTGMWQPDVRSIILHDGNLYAATDGGVFRSSNDGATWSDLNTGLLNTDDYAVGDAGSYLFVGSYGSGIFRTSDSVLDWEPVPTSSSDYGLFDLCIVDSKWLAVSGIGLVRSTDSGTTWAKSETGINYHRAGALRLGPFVKKDSFVFCGTGSGVFQSTDGGSNWQSPCPGFQHRIESLIVKDGYLFVGTDMGLSRSSNNGATWSDISSGIVDTVNDGSVPFLVVIGTELFAGTDGSLFRSNDDGASWQRAAGGLPPFISNFVYGFVGGNSGLFVFLDPDGVFRSTDMGQSWNIVDSIPSFSALTSVGTNDFLGSSGRVLLSTDKGNSWTSVSDGLDSSYVSSFVPTDSMLLASTSFGVAQRSLWEMILRPASDTASVSLNDTGVMGILINSDSGKRRLHQIALKNSLGSPLIITRANLTGSDSQFAIVQVLPALPDTVYPGDKCSIILQFRGDTSQPIVQDTMLLTIDQGINHRKLMQPQSESLFAIHLTGYSFSPPAAVTTAPSSISPLTLDARVTENPFPTATGIWLSLNQEAYVKIAVFDLLGREVAVAGYEGMREEGVQEVPLDLVKSPPGVYYVRIEGDGTEVRTLKLTKQ